MYKKNSDLKKVYLTKDYIRFNENSYKKEYSSLIERQKIISKFVKKKNKINFGCWLWLCRIN